MSGGCNVYIARKLRRIPLWIFHGEKDDVVKPDDDRALAKALEKLHTQRFTGRGQFEPDRTAYGRGFVL